MLPATQGGHLTRAGSSVEISMSMTGGKRKQQSDVCLFACSLNTCFMLRMAMFALISAEIMRAVHREWRLYPNRARASANG